MAFDLSVNFPSCDDWLLFVRYSGMISSAVIDDALQKLDSGLEEKGCPLGFCKKVYSIVVEGLQNLFHHGDTIPVQLQEQLGCAKNYGAFCVGLHEGECKVLMGNFVDAAQREALVERLEMVNGLDAEGLRVLYREVLNNQLYSQKGGGGLGLIDIARKSREQLTYHFSPVDGGYYFYTLLIRIQP